MINLLLNIFCSLELVLAHVVFFQKSVDFISINSLIIFIQAFFLYGLLLTFGKKTVLTFAVLANILIMLLLVYHRVYVTPIMLATISAQYAEGITYLERALPVFLSWQSFGALVYLLAIIFLVSKFFKQISRPWLWRLVFSVPLLILVGLSYGTYHHEEFNEHHFKNYTRIFGYPQGWLYEMVTNSDMAAQLDYVIEMANEKPQPLPSELQNLKPHKHIYLIQIESFQYIAFTKEENGKKVMPFLNKIAQDGALYQILPKNPHPSANSDFAVLSGVSDISNFYYVVYQIVSPEKLYSRLTPMTWKYKEKGYRTDFYHGFVNTFYNRGPHFQAMKFDEIYFQKDVLRHNKLKEGDWGIDDMEMVRFIINNQHQNPADKSFTFFITVSSHDPFTIGETENKIYDKPQNLLERYYNSFNYVDRSLEYLVKNTPQDSLFLIYSDHPSIESEPEDTFFMVYSKKQKFSHFVKINFEKAMQIVKSVLHENLKTD